MGLDVLVKQFYAAVYAAVVGFAHPNIGVLYRQLNTVLDPSVFLMVFDKKGLNFCLNVFYDN